MEHISKRNLLCCINDDNAGLIISRVENLITVYGEHNEDFEQSDCLVQDTLGWGSLDYYDHYRNQCAIQTTAGSNMLGWVPRNARAADAVYAFLGCPRPFVLHPDEGGHFLLLGDAWFHGVLEDNLFQMTTASSELIEIH